MMPRKSFFSLTGASIDAAGITCFSSLLQMLYVSHINMIDICAVLLIDYIRVILFTLDNNAIRVYSFSVIDIFDIQSQSFSTSDITFLNVFCTFFHVGD